MNGTVDLICTLNRRYIPPDKGQKLFLKIDINPTGGTGESLPVAVCLLIDRSGSMVGKKLRSAKEGACNLVVQLTNRDYCGVVTFESKVAIVVPGQFVRNPQLFEDKIKEISLGGTTELYRGLDNFFSNLHELSFEAIEESPFSYSPPLFPEFHRKSHPIWKWIATHSQPLRRALCSP